MNRQQKELVVQLLREEFSTKPASFIVELKGLTVPQMQSLRKELRGKGGKLKVAKARLMKLATTGIESFNDFVPYLEKKQIGVVFASDEPPAVAKVLDDFAKSHEALKLVVGHLDAQLLDKQGITRIAKLPSKDILRAQLCGTLQAPIAGLATVLHALIARLLWVLKRIEEQKQAK